VFTKHLTLQSYSSSKYLLSKQKFR